MVSGNSVFVARYTSHFLQRVVLPNLSFIHALVCCFAPYANHQRQKHHIVEERLGIDYLETELEDHSHGFRRF